MIRMHLTQVVLATAVMGLAAAPAYADLAVQHDSTTVTETAGNGNGVAEPGDTLAVTENVMSVDPDQTFTNVSGTLATGFAGATIGSASSAYADLAFAASTGNTTPFSVSLANTMECGVAIPMTLSLSTNAGPTDVQFRLPTGSPGPWSSYDSTNGPEAIPDGDSSGLLSNLSIAGTGGRVKNIRVRVGQITHTYDGDLTLYLVSPDGQSVKLVGGKGADGDNFTNTVFDDSATSTIRSTTPAPFTGTFKPAQPLSSLDGAPLTGNWTLRVVDSSSGDIGTLDAWGLDISAAVCAPQPLPPPAGNQHDCGLHNGQGNAFGLIRQASRDSGRECPTHGRS